jgi:hypothetical protein
MKIQRDNEVKVSTRTRADARRFFSKPADWPVRLVSGPNADGVSVFAIWTASGIPDQRFEWRED